ncbi:MAG: hypothetical protein PHQ23_12690 [Candidatus Wallbacteria bacterium]|nr:hypothetical protein [Candidatus Wallbacteria bacterium]
MKHFLFIFILAYSVSCSADYDKALNLYHQALDLLSTGEVEAAASAYRKALDEDLQVLKLQDHGLAKILLYLLEREDDPLASGRYFLLYGYSEKARSFFQDALTRFSPDSAQFQEARSGMELIDLLLTQTATMEVRSLDPLDQSQQMQDWQKLPPPPPGGQLPGDPADQVKYLKFGLPAMERALNDQERQWRTAEEERRKWGGIDVTGTGGNKAAEQYFGRIADAEKTKFDDMRIQFDNLKERISELEKILDKDQH